MSDRIPLSLGTLTFVVLVLISLGSISISPSVAIISRGCPVVSSSRVWYVDDDGGADFEMIQDAIDAASSGDTVYVHRGWYFENVVIDKSLRLVGEDRDDTVIYPVNGLTAVKINAYGCVVKNFSFRHSHWVHGDSFAAGINVSSNGNLIQNNTFFDDHVGIYLSGVSNNSVAFNLFELDEHSYGIYLNYSSTNVISSNDISLGLMGIYLMESSSNTIVLNNVECGISLRFSSNNSVSFNTLFRSDIGLYSSSNNTIQLNTLGSVSLSSSSNNNTVANNTASGLIDLYSSSGNNVTLNDCSAIVLGSSHFNVIAWNKVFTPKESFPSGLSLTSSNYNNITHNDVEVDPSAEFGVGIEISGSGNLISTSNTLNGKPVYYLHDEHDKVLDGLDTAHLTLHECSNITIINSNISNGDGIFLFRTSGIHIINNTISSNHLFGVQCLFSRRTNITRNMITSNGYTDIYGGLHGTGIFIGPSLYDAITYNVISSNLATGISLSGDIADTKIYRNNIVGNGFGMHTSKAINATQNWWGCATGPYHSELNPWGRGNEVDDNIEVDPWLKAPVSMFPVSYLALSLKAPTSYEEFEVEISGRLAYENGTGIPEVTILIEYSINGRENWNMIAKVNTTTEGNYSAIWMPNNKGHHFIRAAWAGNTAHRIQGASLCIAFSRNYISESHVYSVVSNSTLSTPHFNSTSGEIIFTLSGPSSITGYAKVFIPKKLIGDIANLKVYLNNTQTAHTATSANDSWIIHFTYSHSMYQVIVELGPPPSAPPPPPPSGPSPINPQIIAAICGIVIGIALALISPRKKIKPQTKISIFSYFTKSSRPRCFLLGP